MSNDFLDRIASRAQAPIAAPIQTTRTGGQQGGVSFQDVLRQAEEQGAVPLRISAHASARLQQRGLMLTSEDWKRVAEAVAKASDKGARDTYVLYGSTGLVVNVPNRTVVTAIAHDEETVVTNIDSVVTARLDR